MGKEKKTKEEKRAESKAFMEELKKMPKGKLSKIALYWLAHENDEPVEMDMRAVLR